MTSGPYPWSFVTHIFHTGQPSHGGDRQKPLKYLPTVTEQSNNVSEFLVK